MAEKAKKYDVIIIGGGPAGLSAGIYTARDRLKTLLLESAMVGGQAANAERLDNYPGFPDGINGAELTELMHRQAGKYGMETITAEVTGLKPKEKQNTVLTTEGNFSAGAVIIAGGCHHQKLGVPGEADAAPKGLEQAPTIHPIRPRRERLGRVGRGHARRHEVCTRVSMLKQDEGIHLQPEPLRLGIEVRVRVDAGHGGDLGVQICDEVLVHGASFPRQTLA